MWAIKIRAGKAGQFSGWRTCPKAALFPPYRGSAGAGRRCQGMCRSWDRLSWNFPASAKAKKGIQSEISLGWWAGNHSRKKIFPPFHTQLQGFCFHPETREENASFRGLKGIFPLFQRYLLVFPQGSPLCRGCGHPMLDLPMEREWMEQREF